MIEELLRRVNEVTGGNQFMAAALSAWLLGVATFVLRKIPADILGLVKKHLTTSITITSHNISFYTFMQWLDSSGKSRKFRRVKITNGQWGDEAATKAVGYGRHLLWLGTTPTLIDLSRIDTHSEREKEEIVLSKLGRSHKVFDSLLIKIKTADEDSSDKMTSIRQYARDDWITVKQPKRSMDSIFLPDADKNRLVAAINKFKADEQWYIDHGIPYQLGILLYGPPGTGKTSLIRALASYMNCGIVMIPATQLQRVSELATTKDILVIEDVDSNTMTTDREEKQQQTIKAAFAGGGISEILNALDGILVSHGRVTVMTTNHIEKLDPALIRPGRVDLKMRIGYVTGPVFDDFAQAFFSTQPKLGEPTKDVTVADIQNMVLLGKDLAEIITACYGKDLTPRNQSATIASDR